MDNKQQDHMQQNNMQQSERAPRPLRWGIAGAGAIARRFCQDINRYAVAGQVVAIAARDQARAVAFADEQGLALAFDYQGLAACGEVDAVYVAVIHPHHGALIKQMLLAGKHVLVEKPAVTRVAQWDELVALAQGRGLMLMEAMKVMCFPAWRALWQRLPLLPLPHTLQAAFGSVSVNNDKLFDPALDGGAAWDVGVYPLWLYAALCARLGLVAGEPVTRLVRAAGEVDQLACFTFGGPLTAELGAAIVQDMDKAAYLAGPGWALVLEGKWWNPQHIRWQAGAPLAAWPHDISLPVQGGGMQHEADHFASCVAQGWLDSPWVPQGVTRQVLGWVETALHTG